MGTSTIIEIQICQLASDVVSFSLNEEEISSLINYLQRRKLKRALVNFVSNYKVLFWKYLMVSSFNQLSFKFKQKYIKEASEVNIRSRFKIGTINLEQMSWVEWDRDWTEVRFIVLARFHYRLTDLMSLALITSLMFEYFNLKCHIIWKYRTIFPIPK